MNPKKVKVFIDEISNELKEDPNLIEVLVDFYYKECRSILSNLKDTRLNIEGLGHFVSKSNYIKKSIDKYKKVLKNHDTSTFSAYYNKKTIEDKLQLLIKLMELHNLEQERKDNYKKIKNEFKENMGK
tara:strand:+ start:298 stop:681 length:384 start_codon:yes stop_codon:yes gene_type:complete